MSSDLNIASIPQPQAESLAEVTGLETSEPARKAWERRPNESTPAFAAFCAFLPMGSGRSYRKLAKKMGKQNSQISEWGGKYDWGARALAWDDDRWQTRDVERRRANQAEAEREARESTARQRARCRQEEKFSDVFLSRIGKMFEFHLESGTLKTMGADGIAKNTTVKSPRWSLDTAAKHMKLVSDLREQWSREAREIAGKDMERQEEWNIEDYHMPDRFPSQIAGDPERSLAPSAPPTDEVAAETAGPTVNAWDRLPQESARSSAGFRAFLELGSGRSCRQVARNLSRERSQILDWSRKHDWVNRSRAWDNHNWEENHVERAKATKVEAERSAQEQTAREQTQRQQEEKIVEQFSDRAVRMAESALATMTTTTVQGPDGKISHDTLITPRFSMNTTALFLKTALQLRQRSNRNARAMADEEQDRGEDWEISDDDPPPPLRGQTAGDAERPTAP